jgi:hypothetical protein
MFSISSHMSLAVTEQCMDEDRCWSVKGKAMHTGMLQIFLTRVKMHTFAAKWVPPCLNEVQ